jgi:hypothetical protein
MTGLLEPINLFAVIILFGTFYTSSSQGPFVSVENVYLIISRRLLVL